MPTPQPARTQRKGASSTARPARPTCPPKGAPQDADRANTTWTMRQTLFERGPFPLLFTFFGGAWLFQQVIGIAATFPAAMAFPLIFVVAPLMFVVALLVGTGLTRLWLTIRKAPHAEPELVRYCRANGRDIREALGFTWYAAYGTVIGLFVWQALGMPLMTMVGPIGVLGSYIAAWIVARLINACMFACTHTNDLTIEAVKTGYFDDLFTKKDARKRDAEKRMVIKSLEHRDYGTVRGTLKAVRVSRALSRLSIIGGLIMLAISIFLFHMLNATIKKELQNAAADRVQGVVNNARSNDPRPNNDAYEQEQKKRRDRQWKEDQMRRKQSVADYERRRGHPETADAWDASVNRDRQDLGL